MMERNSSECLLKKLDKEIVLLDGAMGTMIQQHKLEEKDFRNEALQITQILCKATTTCSPSPVPKLSNRSMEFQSRILFEQNSSVLPMIPGHSRKSVGTTWKHRPNHCCVKESKESISMPSTDWKRYGVSVN